MKQQTLRKPRDLLLVFEILAIFLVFYTNRGLVNRELLFIAGGLILIIYVSNFILGKVTTGDNYIFLIVSFLLTIGLVMIFRIEPEKGLKQLQWAFLGVIVFYMTYFFTRYVKGLENWGTLAILASLVLFAMTLLFGREIGGAKNWLSIGPVQFQPSELIKILLMFILAGFYANYEKYTKYKYASYIIMSVVYVFLLLLLLQRDLGTAAIFVAMFSAIQFIYDKNRKAILVHWVLLVLGAIAAYFLFRHVQVRVSTWLDPWSDVYNTGRQLAQSLIAIAEGGFFGTGIGYGYPQLIPVSETDFIFPVIIEEMGLFAGFGIIMLYLLLTYRGIKIALSQEYLFYRILALCCTLLFAVQSFVNIGGVIKLIPMTGVTLPFVSYGGTSILSSFMALGILQVTSEDLSGKEERGSEVERVQ
ncbi:MAG: FtsW/RodA/SpoVE family cell cycle protein [Tissierellia bacterium]|nr:FtsW/RodA/SpoVE family cell cycle protein [Tissierellia bacterium]